MVLKQFLKSVFDSKDFDFDYEAPNALTGRPSNAFNEDDYDYAIELREHDEYRDVAAREANITGFSEENINKAVEMASKKRRESIQSILTFGTSEKERHDDSSDESHSNSNDEIDFSQRLQQEDSTIASDEMDSSEEDEEMNDKGLSTRFEQNYFYKKMFVLSKRKRWIETRARRASQNFIDDKFVDGDEALSRFRLAVTNGVIVRRHQANKFAENVSLIAPGGDFDEIRWEPEEDAKSRSFCRNSLMVQRKSMIFLRDGENPNDFATSTINACVKLCGCGAGLGGSLFDQQDNNKGYTRKGALKLEDILVVHPAVYEDPSTYNGEIATRAFRNSKDEYNAALSFSIITTSLIPGEVNTLDIECLDEDSYFVLLNGFFLLRRELAKRRQANDTMKNCQNERFTRHHMFSFFKTNGKQKLDNGLSKGNLTISQLSPTKRAKAETNPFEEVLYRGDDPLMLQSHYDQASYNETFEEFKMNQSNFLTPPAQFLGWKTEGTQIWARLRMAGLEVKPVFSTNLKKVILKIRCPTWRLEEVAERMHIRLRLRTGGFKRFKISQRELYVTNPFDGTIFRSSERQRVIDFIIRSKIKDGGAELDDTSSLGKAITQRFPLHMKSRLYELKYSWIYFWKREKPGEVAAPWSPFSESLSVSCRRFYESVAYCISGTLDQPLDQVAEYFGESVAFYFAWLAFCTRWMALPALLGIAVFIVQIISLELDHWICIPYAIFIMIWASVMMAHWRQKSSALAYRWGVLGFEAEETERPQFYGQTAFDPNSKEMVKIYPPWKRLLKYCVSVPIMLLLTMTMLAFMFVILFSQEQLALDYERGKDISYLPRFDVWNFSQQKADESDSGVQLEWSFEFMMTVLYYPSMYGLMVAIAAQITKYLGYKLTSYENHRKESTYVNRLILKVFTFRFTAVFTPVFYYAFAMNNSEESYFRMSLSIFAMMTFGDWSSKFFEGCIPFWIHGFRMYRMSSAVSSINKLIWAVRMLNLRSESASCVDDGDANNDNSALRDRTAQEVATREEIIARREKYLTEAQSDCWSDSLKEDYSSIEDYTDTILQLGFILLFGAVFPLAPAIALLNNLFFIRIDAAKLMYTRKRPIAQKIGGLGVWEDIIHIMSVIGIITTCCLLAFTSEVLEGLFYFTNRGIVVLLLFFFEHIILFLKYVLMSSVNRIPLSVQRDQERNKIKSSEQRRRRLEHRMSMVNSEFHQNDHDENDENDGTEVKCSNKSPFQDREGDFSSRKQKYKAKVLLPSDSFSSALTGLTSMLQDDQKLKPRKLSAGSNGSRRDSVLATDPFTFANASNVYEGKGGSILESLYKYSSSNPPSPKLQESSALRVHSESSNSDCDSDADKSSSTDEEDRIVQPRNVLQRISSAKKLVKPPGPGPVVRPQHKEINSMAHSLALEEPCSNDRGDHTDKPDLIDMTHEPSDNYDKDFVDDDYVDYATDEDDEDDEEEMWNINSTVHNLTSPSFRQFDGPPRQSPNRRTSNAASATSRRKRMKRMSTMSSLSQDSQDFVPCEPIHSNCQTSVSPLHSKSPEAIQDHTSPSERTAERFPDKRSISPSVPVSSIGLPSPCSPQLSRRNVKAMKNATSEEPAWERLATPPVLERKQLSPVNQPVPSLPTPEQHHMGSPLETSITTKKKKTSEQRGKAITSAVTPTTENNENERSKDNLADSCKKAPAETCKSPALSKLQTVKAKPTALTPRSEKAYQKHLSRLNTAKLPRSEEKKPRKKKKEVARPPEVDMKPPRAQTSPKTKSLKSHFISWLRSEETNQDASSYDSDSNNPFRDVLSTTEGDMY